MIANLILAAILVLVAGTVLAGLAVGFRTFLRYCGQRLVTCPENQETAAVHVDAAKAASSRLIGKPEIRLDQCSRWPEMRNCGQQCLSKINADPENCLVWNIVGNWYKGKTCAYCQKPFGEIHWHDRHPALLSPEHVAKQWNEVPAEQLPKIFETCLPVCWNCYVAETFRQQNPDRVLNRNWERDASGEYAPKEDAPQKRAG